VFWTGVDVTIVFGELLHSSDNIAKNILEIQNEALQVLLATRIQLMQDGEYYMEVE
jgi:hypothetical protein